jgi:type IV pilus assembly protein PilE
MKLSVQKGITLIELMIAVAIVAILTSIAYPSYVNHLQTSRRTEAMAALTRIANLQEKNYMDNGTYATDLTKLGVGASPFITENSYYSISSATIDKTAPFDDFTLTATAQNAQANDSHCATFTLTSTGVKGGTNADCWN